METVDSSASENDRPDPDRLIGMFIAAAEARKTERDLHYAKGHCHTTGGHGAAEAYHALGQASRATQAARFALSKTLENEWLSRRVRIRGVSGDKPMFHPVSDYKEHAAASVLEGSVVMIPGYETYDNILLVQTHPDAPPYIAHVLNQQLKPLITLSLLEDEQPPVY